MSVCISVAEQIDLCGAWFETTIRGSFVIHLPPAEKFRTNPLILYQSFQTIIECIDPLRAKKTFIRKHLVIM